MWPLESSALQVLCPEAEKMGSSSTYKGERRLGETVLTSEWEVTLVVAGPSHSCFLHICENHLGCVSFPAFPQPSQFLSQDFGMMNTWNWMSFLCQAHREQNTCGVKPPLFSATKAWMYSRRLGCGPCLPGPLTTAAQAQISPPPHFHSPETGPWM